MNVRERIINIYRSGKGIVNNFKKNGDPEQVGYSLLVSSIIYGLIPIQVAASFAIMKELESTHIAPSKSLGLLSVGLYGLSKLAIYEMNKKMLESKHGWSADLYTNAFKYAGLNSTKAARLGAISEFIVGTTVNPVDWAAFGALIISPFTRIENPISASIFLSKSLLVPIYFTGANLLIHAGSVDPVLKKIRKVRSLLTKK